IRTVPIQIDVSYKFISIQLCLLAGMCNSLESSAKLLGFIDAQDNLKTYGKMLLEGTELPILIYIHCTKPSTKYIYISKAHRTEALSFRKHWLLTNSNWGISY